MPARQMVAASCLCLCVCLWQISCSDSQPFTSVAHQEIWVRDRTTGKPIADARVLLYVARGGATRHGFVLLYPLITTSTVPFAQGITSTEGVVVFCAPRSMHPNSKAWYEVVSADGYEASTFEGTGFGRCAHLHRLRPESPGQERPARESDIGQAAVSKLAKALERGEDLTSPAVRQRIEESFLQAVGNEEGYHISVTEKGVSVTIPPKH